MAGRSRTELLEAQRRYVEQNTCTHLVACAVTQQQRDNATELMRSGNALDAYLGTAMLTGPCVPKED